MQEDKQLRFLRKMTVDEVASLPVGFPVFINGKDADGNDRKLMCVVASSGGKKFLTYRESGSLRRCRIKEYPGKYYSLEV